jgi:ArsR family transcriptional regulator
MNSSLHQFKAEFFKTLSHPLRLAILDALREGERSVSQLQNATQADQSVISQQLAILRTKGFLDHRKEGTTVLYRARDLEVYAFLDLGRRIFERQLQYSSDLLGRIRNETASVTS